MKIIDIQKNLLLSHLGLVGINTELLDTFPVKDLKEKSDDQVCIIFTINFKNLNSEAQHKSLSIISKYLEVSIGSIDKKDENTLSSQVFYDSLTMHWSDKACLHFEVLSSKLELFNVRISTSVSLNV